MLYEYFRNAYDNMFRFQNRFWAVIVSISLATFCLIGLTSIIQDMEKFNEYKIKSLSEKNKDYLQYIIQTSSLENHIENNEVKNLIEITDSNSGYYFEDFSYYLWDYNYLIPWIEFNNKQVLETKPIMIGLEDGNNYQALKDQIIYGKFLSGNPDEVLIDINILNQFVKSSDVFKDKLIIIDDGKRKALEEGKGLKVSVDEILGKSIQFIYNVDFHVDKTKGTYYIETKKSLPLKVVGVFDSKEGYPSPGNVWLPLNIKDKLKGLNVTNVHENLSGKVSLQHEKPFITPNQINSIKRLGFSISNYKEPPAYLVEELNRLQVRKLIYQIVLFISISLGVISTFVISYLMSSERSYEFQLLRALGASKKQIQFLFSLEMFLISFIGSLVGLMLSLLVAKSSVLSRWIGTEVILDGQSTILIILLMPAISALIGYIQVNFAIKQNISFTLKEMG